MAGILTGIGWHMVGAASAASFYAPIEKVKKWSWDKVLGGSKQPLRLDRRHHRGFDQGSHSTRPREEGRRDGRRSSFAPPRTFAAPTGR